MKTYKRRRLCVKWRQTTAVGGDKSRPQGAKNCKAMFSNKLHWKHQKENEMKKWSVFLVFVLSCALPWSLFAGGGRDSPTKQFVYGDLGPLVYGGFGAGYEGAIGNYFSLGPYIDYTAGGDADHNAQVNILARPRIYFFGSALEKLFVGGRLGLGVNIDAAIADDTSSTNNDPYYDHSGNPGEESSIGDMVKLVAGAEVGYKFVFGSGSTGFSVEPSIGYAAGVSNPFTIGLAVGFAWGGNGGGGGTSPVLNLFLDPPAEKTAYTLA
jgi:hypothetical protein